MGPANKDSGAAGRVPGTGDFVRTKDFDSGQVRDRRVSKLNAGLEVGSRRFGPLNQIIHVRLTLLEERDHDGLRSSFDRHPNFKRSRGRVGVPRGASSTYVVI